MVWICGATRSVDPSLRRDTVAFIMLRSARVGLLALLRGLRFVGNTLKHFLLRCLLFWPDVLRGLRRIWHLCSRASPKDIPKKKDLGGQARPLFPGASGCEGYSTIYASRDLGRGPNRSSEPHLPLESGSTRVLHLRIDPPAEQAPRTDSPVSLNSPSLSSIHLPDPVEIQLPTIPRLNAPLTLTHSRITSTQFAGSARRAQSRSQSPHRHTLSFPPSTTLMSFVPSPDHSQRPPSPLLFPQPRRLSLSSVPDNSGGTQIPDVVIRVSPPARSDSPQSIDDDNERFPPSPAPFQEGNIS